MPTELILNLKKGMGLQFFKNQSKKRFGLHCVLKCTLSNSYVKSVKQAKDKHSSFNTVIGPYLNV